MAIDHHNLVRIAGDTGPGRRHHEERVLIASVAAVMATGVIAPIAHADDTLYQFTKVVDESAGFESLSCTSIGDDGTVVFRDGRGQTGYDHYLATPQSVDPLLTLDDLGAGLGHGELHRNGDVVALANHTGDLTMGWRVTVAGDGTIETIGTTDHPILVAHALSINDEGQVLYSLTQQDYTPIYVVWDNGEIVQEVAVSRRGDHPFDTGGTSAFLNDDGQLAMSGNSAGVYLVEEGEFTEIVDESIIQSGRLVGFNDQGTVLIRGGSHALYTVGADGQVDPIVSGGQLDVAHHKQHLNNQGDVVFAASPAGSSNSGVFDGGDPVTDKVLTSGDSLFGDTVQAVGLCGINDDGAVALQVSADGQTMIVVAEKG